ncbi:MAG TPA: J domain-containing protein [Candidatus Nitrosotalea sp.]|nr:J domain-containing protein [Candidatus Nitrosotalea sp.]
MLGLHEGATMQEIKEAYRKLALRYHPDKNVSKQDGEKFKIITEAYQMLRTNYDDGLKKSVYSSYGTSRPNSKISHWRKIVVDDKVLIEWFQYAKYADRAYKEICKCEQMFLKYCEKITNPSNSNLLSSFSTPCNRDNLFLTLNTCKQFLKKRSKNFKSTFNL